MVEMMGEMGIVEVEIIIALWEDILNPVMVGQMGEMEMGIVEVEIIIALWEDILN